MRDGFAPDGRPTVEEGDRLQAQFVEPVLGDDEAGRRRIVLLRGRCLRSPCRPA